MPFARRPWRRAAALFCALLLTLLGVPLSAAAAEKSRIRVEDYVIDAELTPKLHRLAARARVKFTALEDISVAIFELHNGLRVTRVEDAGGHVLSVERVTQDSTVRVPLPAGLSKNASTTLTFDYEGVLASADDSPVEGLKLAYVGENESYLLYAGRWFPMVGYGTNRFAATINVTVPAGTMVVGSGRRTVAAASSPGPGARGAARGPAPPAARTTYTFVWEKPSFPGTIIAGPLEESISRAGGMVVQVYFTAKEKPQAAAYADTALKELEYFSSLYGPAPASMLNLVELPDDTLPSAWAPGVAAIARRGISEKINYRLLANTLARQWWGVLVSPATREDFWLSEGFARYSEARYVESAAGQAGFEEAVKDMAAGALAYDTIPLSGVGKLDTFAPEFQSLVTDKGAMILHMLRWVMGDAVYDQTMRRFAAQYAWKPATSDNFRKLAEANSRENLAAFFAQWLDSTGAPEFKNKYTVYRLGGQPCTDPNKCKGFRIAGEVFQDLDLFRMPLEVRIDTDGQTEYKRIEVVGTNSPYVVETFGKPRRITLDPNGHVLKNAGEFKVRASILRGQQLVQQGDLAEALKEFQKALESNHNSSLAHYRIAEVFFLQRNYQAAANAYRESLNGDGEPRWTEVWSHLQLGKIFDLTGQRERATNEYRQALQTSDNTQGAQEEARKYLQAPYQREKPKDAGT